MEKVMDYCRRTIPDFSKRESAALKRMGEYRCTLLIADSDLYKDIAEKVEEYGNVNEVDMSEVEIEDIFWNNS